MTHLERLSAVIQAFKDLDENMLVEEFLLLLDISKAPGKSQQEYHERLGLHQASISRFVAHLSAKRGPGEPGLSLITGEEDRFDRRKRLIYLTPKGERFVKGLEEILARE